MLFEPQTLQALALVALGLAAVVRYDAFDDSGRSPHMLPPEEPEATTAALGQAS